MPRTIARPAATLSLGAALLALGSLAGHAQSPCASPYVVQPGDTLFKITQQCRVRLDALRSANPDIVDERDIAIGARLTIPGGRDGGAGEDGDPTAGSRTIRAGDTLYSIARETGTTVRALLDANPGIVANDLRIGLALRIPGSVDRGEEPGPDDDRRTIAVQPLAGAPGAPITVTGAGYEPGGRVTVGWGPPGSEWEPLRRVRADRDGDVRAELRIPRAARPGRQIVFVIDTPAGVTSVSERIDIVAERDPDAPSPDEPDIRTLEGRISSGVECPVLDTPDGRRFSLAGAGRFDEGDYVRVVGTEAEASFCMQGQATIEVRRMTEIAPPARDRDPDRAGGVPLTRDYVLAPWAAKGGDCRRPDFDVTGNAAGGQVVETSLEGAPRTGYVRLGFDPAFVFDQPRRVMPIETRGPDGLAVMPPASGPVTLGGVRIRGDGAVFVRCPS